MCSRGAGFYVSLYFLLSLVFILAYIVVTLIDSPRIRESFTLRATLILLAVSAVASVILSLGVCR